MEQTENKPDYNPQGKSFLAWVGGKSQLSKQIIELMPKHHCYCEVFGGAAWVLFKKTQSPVEVFNDINGELVNLYRVLKHHLDEFIRQFDYVLLSRDEFARFKKQSPECLTDIQRAVRYYYLVRLSYGTKAVDHSFASAASRALSIDLSRFKDSLSEANKRLSHVTVENQHYSKIIQRFDTDKTLFYLDPPYYGYENYYGNGIFSRDDFALLRDQLKAIKGKFILSVNNAIEIKELFSDFTIIETSARWSLGLSTKPDNPNELIIKNF
ncbi:DNA adenine methylase [Agitococcus lubricus]|uniref:site-specific DNA-methyltransferase (adenine-specific) n=1 Tax=Agitococcus lubricus TaxID=1077255 RepID=A0A2T5J3U7_9GAMM|nr:DNA adenine methylase [Agitococcus lubricus]PTQ91284.1 DNA adenine methylase [Agitococcus lubricus]